jgi:hypothetical protein
MGRLHLHSYMVPQTQKYLSLCFAVDIIELCPVIFQVALIKETQTHD